MDTKRLMKVLRWNIIGTRSYLTRQTMLLFAAFCFIIFSQNISGLFGKTIDYESVSRAASVALTASAVITLLWASQITFNMKTKTEFVNYAMLPATNAEKFLANLLFQTVVRFAQVTIAIIAADFLYCIVSLIVVGDVSSVTLCILSRFFDKMCSETLFDNTLTIGDTISAALFIHSTYIFGGTFFRKHQFLWTTLFWIFNPLLLLTIFGFTFGGALYYLERNGYEVTINWMLGDTAIGFIISICVILMALGVYFLAYRRFCRIQLINNKFFN